MYQSALVLSGGAARGFAHAGVVKALYEAGFRFDAISGVSAGAIVAAFLADGFEPETIFECFAKEQLFSFIKPSFHLKGLFKAEGLKEVLEQNLKATTFEQLKTPLFVGATNIETGRLHFFNSGPLVPAILASCAVPLIFNPVKINGCNYVDGGIVSNLPVEPFIDKSFEIIGIDVNPVGEVNQVKGFTDYINRILHIAIQGNVQANKQHCTLLFEPSFMEHYSFFGVSKGTEMYKKAYAYANEVLQKIT